MKKIVAASDVEARVKKPKKQRNGKYADELERLKDYKPDPKLMKAMYDAFDDAYKDMERQKREIIGILFIGRAITDNITFREACERYFVEEVPISDSERAVRITDPMEYRIRLTKRPEAMRLDEESFKQFELDTLTSLYKKLKI